jgi:hypothetical protein
MAVPPDGQGRGHARAADPAAGFGGIVAEHHADLEQQDHQVAVCGGPGRLGVLVDQVGDLAQPLL